MISQLVCIMEWYLIIKQTNKQINSGCKEMEMGVARCQRGKGKP